MPNWPYKRNNSSSFGFSYSLTAIIPASAALIQPLLLLLNAKLTLQKKQFLLLRFSYSLTAIIPASAALIQPLLLLLNAKLTLQKNQFLLLRLLLLSHGHYSRFCCSLTASAAPPKCKPDLTKEPIPPLAASPTLSRPLFPLLLLPYSLCCSF
jgi:hypothetical protein